jgi:pimeloyl-ACP methyl ester carboxylesterase
MNLIRKYADFKNLKISYQDNELNKDVIFVTHANGFSGSCYLYLYRYFGDKYRWIFLDFVGHSYSEASLEFNDWNFFRDQIFEIIKIENLQNIIGIGHSLGGASLALSAKYEKQFFKKLLLLDPTLLSITTNFLGKVIGNYMADNAIKRRRDFKSKDQIKKIFKRIPAFSNWEESVFNDYLQSCFRDIENGVELSCPPEVESKIFSTNPIFFSLNYKNLNVSTKIIIPRKSTVCSESAAKKLIGGTVDSSINILENENHFFPFENPDLVIKELEFILHG